MKRLKAPKDKTEAMSYAGVIKNALRLYEALIAETAAGNKVLIEAGKGVGKTYLKIF